MKTRKTNILLAIIAINLTLIMLAQLNIWPTRAIAHDFNLDPSINYGLVPLNENGSIDVNISSSNSIIDVNLQKIIGHFPGIHESYTLAGDKYYGLDVTINN